MMNKEFSGVIVKLPRALILLFSVFFSLPSTSSALLPVISTHRGAFLPTKHSMIGRRESGRRKKGRKWKIKHLVEKIDFFFTTFASGWEISIVEFSSSFVRFRLRIFLFLSFENEFEWRTRVGGVTGLKKVLRALIKHESWLEVDDDESWDSFSEKYHNHILSPSCRVSTLRLCCGGFERCYQREWKFNWSTINYEQLAGVMEISPIRFTSPTSQTHAKWWMAKLMMLQE